LTLPDTTKVPHIEPVHIASLDGVTHLCCGVTDFFLITDDKLRNTSKPSDVPEAAKVVFKGSRKYSEIKRIFRCFGTQAMVLIFKSGAPDQLAITFHRDTVRDDIITFMEARIRLQAGQHAPLQAQFQAAPAAPALTQGASDQIVDSNFFSGTSSGAFGVHAPDADTRADLIINAQGMKNEVRLHTLDSKVVSATITKGPDNTASLWVMAVPVSCLLSRSETILLSESADQHSHHPHKANANQEPLEKRALLDVVPMQLVALGDQIQISSGTTTEVRKVLSFRRVILESPLEGLETQEIKAGTVVKISNNLGKGELKAAAKEGDEELKVRFHDFEKDMECKVGKGLKRGTELQIQRDGSVLFVTIKFFDHLVVGPQLDHVYEVGAQVTRLGGELHEFNIALNYWKPPHMDVVRKEAANWEIDYFGIQLFTDQIQKRYEALKKAKEALVVKVDMSGKKVGLVCGPAKSGDGLKVMFIQDGVIQDYNNENQDKEVKVGAFIAEVNSKKKAGEMLEELSRLDSASAGQLELKITPEAKNNKANGWMDQLASANPFAAQKEDEPVLSHVKRYELPPKEVLFEAGNEPNMTLTFAEEKQQTMGMGFPGQASGGAQNEPVTIRFFDDASRERWRQALAWFIAKLDKGWQRKEEPQR
jgi:hypothetical protein